MGERRITDAHDLRRPLERASSAMVPAVLTGVALVLVVNAVFDFSSLARGQSRAIGIYDLTTAAICLVLRWMWLRQPWIHRYTDAVGIVVGTLLVTNTMWAIHSSHEMAYSAHLALVIIGLSSIFFSPYALAIFGVLVLIGWAVAIPSDAARADLAANGFAMLAAAVMAVVIQIARIRGHARLGLLRARDRIRGERLREALSAAKHEIERREIAEREGEELREQLLHAQKMEAVGRLAGGVAHDMNNVLTSIATVGELMLEESHLDDGARDDVESILASARRGAELTRNLLAFSRRGKYASDLLDPTEILEGVRRLLVRTLPKEIELRFDLRHGDARVEGDATQLAQALMNLCVNAADAMPDGGVVNVRTSRVGLVDDDAHRRAVPPGDYLMIEVQDSGGGMNTETRRLAFEPFFTTKDQGKGTGLGLAMVYGTARNHGGSAEIVSVVDVGTTVTMHLPLATVRKKASEPVSGTTVDVRGRTVLLVDDEPSVRAACKRILERMGLVVSEAENGRRALEVWRTKGPFDLVMLDMAMPVMAGRECFFRLREIAPDVRVLLVSGYAPGADAKAALDAGALGFVEKPYTPAALFGAVRAALRPDPRDERATSSA